LPFPQQLCGTRNAFLICLNNHPPFLASPTETENTFSRAKKHKDALLRTEL
jgi:hypothetical protein